MRNQIINQNKNQNANVATPTATTKAKTSTPRKDVYKAITQIIIEKMKQGKLLWKQGFRQVAAQNWVTKTTYSGINAILLNFVHSDEPCPFFASYKQVKSMGGMVKKGAKGKMVVYYSPLYKKEGKYISQTEYNTLGKEQKKGVLSFSTLRHYFVFNMTDTENCNGFDYEKWEKADLIPDNLAKDEMMINFEEMLSHYKDKPIFKIDRNKNAYAPSLDLILYVPVKRWDNARDFVSTIAHEIIHSTGHEKRLNRPNLMKPHPFGSPEYSAEELVAELGAAFLCQYIGILPTQIENSAAYLQAWIKALENDERLIFKASAQAQKAVDYIFNKKKQQIKN